MGLIRLGLAQAWPFEAFDVFGCAGSPWEEQAPGRPRVEGCLRVRVRQALVQP